MVGINAGDDMQRRPEHGINGSSARGHMSKIWWPHWVPEEVLSTMRCPSMACGGYEHGNDMAGGEEFSVASASSVRG